MVCTATRAFTPGETASTKGSVPPGKPTGKSQLKTADKASSRVTTPARKHPEIGACSMCQVQFNVTKVRAQQKVHSPCTPDPFGGLRIGTGALSAGPSLLCTAWNLLFLQSCEECLAWHTVGEAPAPWTHGLGQAEVPPRSHELGANQAPPRHLLLTGFSLGCRVPAAPNQSWKSVQLRGSNTHSPPG